MEFEVSSATVDLAAQEDLTRFDQVKKKKKKKKKKQNLDAMFQDVPAPNEEGASRETSPSDVSD